MKPTRKAEKPKAAPRGRPFPKKEQSVTEAAQLSEDVEKAFAEAATPAAKPKPVVPPEVEAMRAAKAAQRAADPPPVAAHKTLDAEAEASRLQIQLMKKEQEFRNQAAQSRAKKDRAGYKAAVRNLQALRRAPRYSQDPTRLPEGVTVPDKHMPRWVSLRNVDGKNDPSRMRVGEFEHYGGFIAKDNEGKEIHSRLDQVLMMLPYEGYAERAADCSPQGMAAIQNLEYQAEEEIARANQKNGGAWGKLTGVGLDFDRAQYQREGRDPDAED